MISDEPPPMSNSRIDCGLAVGELAATGDRQRRLRLAVDDLQLEVEPFAHPLEELDAVFRGAAGFGGDQPRPRHPARRHLVAADPQRVERALDRRFAEPAGMGEALAEAHHAREGVDDAKSVRGRTRHQQAAIIRAQIQRGVRAARRAAIPRRPPEARSAIPGARCIWAQLRLSQKRLPAPWRGKRPGHGFAADCSKTRPGCNATQRPGPRRGQGLKNGVAHLVAGPQADLGGDAAVEFEHRRARTARGDRRLRQRLGAIDDPRHRAVAGDEDHVERDVGVLHPEGDRAVALELEQHAAIHRHEAAIHQPPLARRRRRGDLDRKGVVAGLRADG